MRLSFVSLAAVVVVLASCDAASVDQTKISKMATAGVPQAEGHLPVGNRSLRGKKWTEAEEERVSASLDDVILKLTSKKAKVGHLITPKSLDANVIKAYADLLVNQKSYLNKVFVKKNLETMLINPKNAETTFRNWYALGLTDDVIKSRLAGVGSHYDTLFTQYTAFMNRIHGVA